MRTTPSREAEREGPGSQHDPSESDDSLRLSRRMVPVSSCEQPSASADRDYWMQVEAGSDALRRAVP